jgi:pentatricopeptide repeat protein
VVFHRANSDYLQHSNHVYYQAIVAQCLGNTLLKQVRLSAAESYLEESVQLWAACDDPVMRANTVGTIAELYARQGKVDEAITLFDEALALTTQYPDDAFARKLTEDFQQQCQKLEQNNSIRDQKGQLTQTD